MSASSAGLVGGLLAAVVAIVGIGGIVYYVRRYPPEPPTEVVPKTVSAQGGPSDRRFEPASGRWYKGDGDEPSSSTADAGGRI